MMKGAITYKGFPRDLRHLTHSHTAKIWKALRAVVHTGFLYSVQSGRLKAGETNSEISVTRRADRVRAYAKLGRGCRTKIHE